MLKIVFTVEDGSHLNRNISEVIRSDADEIT